MFTFRRPTTDAIRSYLTARQIAPFTYAEIGCTLGPLQARPGWNIDRERVLLGHGKETFTRARVAIERWQMFPREVIEVGWPDVPLCAGNAVGVLYWAAPVQLWLLFAARIIAVIDRESEIAGQCVQQFGFAYGTLADHPERGEERFLVEWNQADDSVWYDLLAISQPAHWLARLAYPFARHEQARFRRLSAAAMQQVIKSTTAHQ